MPKECIGGSGRNCVRLRRMLAWGLRTLNSTSTKRCWPSKVGYRYNIQMPWLVEFSSKSISQIDIFLRLVRKLIRLEVVSGWLVLGIFLTMLATGQGNRSTVSGCGPSLFLLFYVFSTLDSLLEIITTNC